MARPNGLTLFRKPLSYHRNIFSSKIYFFPQKIFFITFIQNKKKQLWGPQSSSSKQNFYFVKFFCLVFFQYFRTLFTFLSHFFYLTCLYTFLLIFLLFNSNPIILYFAGLYICFLKEILNVRSFFLFSF